jgi:hypothetical protein
VGKKIRLFNNTIVFELKPSDVGPIILTSERVVQGYVDLLQILVMWDLDLFSIQWWQAYVKSILIDDNKLFFYDFSVLLAQTCVSPVEGKVVMKPSLRNFSVNNRDVMYVKVLMIRTVILIWCY